MRYLALGDSYTIGEGVAAAERWPAQLAALLRKRGIAVDDPDIVAATGWTTGELAAGIAERAPAGPFDLVSLLIGVNNQYRGLPLDAYAAEVTALLSRAIAFAGGRADSVVAVSIPDWSATPFAEGRDRHRIAREIDAFNAAGAHMAAAAGVSGWVDVTADSRHCDAELDFTMDGLHYNARAYARWAERVLPVALVALESPAT